MEIGAFEILAVAAIALLFFGPSKLPAMGKSIGEAIRGFKKGMSEMQDSMNDEGSGSSKNSNAKSNVNSTANQRPQPEPARQATSQDFTGVTPEVRPDQNLAEDLVKEPAGKTTK